jgi:hypothetical protein
MDTAQILVVAVLLAVVAAGATWLRRGGGVRRDRPPWRPLARAGATGTGRGEVVLDVVTAAPDAAVLRRLAEAAGGDALAADRELDEIRVLDASGRELLVLHRDQPLPTITRPEGLSTSTLPGSGEDGGDRFGDPSATAGSSPARGSVTGAAAPFDLSPRVVAELAERPDGTELVRAILVAGGRDAHVDDRRVIRTGSEAVVVLDDPHRSGLHPDDLSGAYLRYRHSGARRGIVVLLGYAARHEITRRERLAPDLAYVGAEAVQRMADAAALGVDPLRFAVPAARWRDASR